MRIFVIMLCLSSLSALQGCDLFGGRTETCKGQGGGIGPFKIDPDHCSFRIEIDGDDGTAFQVRYTRTFANGRRSSDQFAGTVPDESPPKAAACIEVTGEVTDERGGKVVVRLLKSDKLVREETADGTGSTVTLRYPKSCDVD